MADIAIVAVGSRGDVAPLTGVGVGLLEAGHRVVMAAYTPFADLITGCGLAFRELPEGFEPGAERADVNPVRALTTFLAPSGMRSLGHAVLAALRDDPIDVLLLSPFSELAGHPLAEARGIPSMGLRVQPLSATAAYPPAVLGDWSAGTAGNRFASDAGAWAVDRAYGRVVAGFRRDLGLPEVSVRTLRRRRTAAGWPILHGYSPSIAARPADWRRGLEVTGFWSPAPVVDWQPPPALSDFLAGGAPPVVVGFGSTVTTEKEAERLSDIAARALRQAGVRGIVQAGWAGLRVVADDLLTIGDTPHEWLFPQVAAVAHHCGAGTTAAALRAGVPAIALPGSVGDQPFWARRLYELGATPEPIPQRKLTADRLTAAIRVAVTDDRLRQTTRGLAGLVASDDGTARAVAAVESLLHQPID